MVQQLQRFEIFHQRRSSQLIFWSIKLKGQEVSPNLVINAFCCPF